MRGLPLPPWPGGNRNQCLPPAPAGAERGGHSSDTTKPPAFRPLGASPGRSSSPGSQIPPPEKQDAAPPRGRRPLAHRSWRPLTAQRRLQAPFPGSGTRAHVHAFPGASLHGHVALCWAVVSGPDCGSSGSAGCESSERPAGGERWQQVCRGIGSPVSSCLPLHGGAQTGGLLPTEGELGASGPGELTFTLISPTPHSIRRLICPD